MTIPKHQDLINFYFDCDLLGITLTCFLAYEPAVRGEREYGTGLQLEPDYPATYTLAHAYTPQGLDISPVMKMSLIEEIEEAAYQSMEQ